MIDIKELRQNITTYGLEATCADDLLTLLDRLEAAENKVRILQETVGRCKETVATMSNLWRADNEELEALRIELAQLHKEADKFDDGIDWIQRAMQAEAKIEQMEKQEPVGWLRAVDEALVVTHLGVANENDTYEQAREKLNNLIGWHTDVATDPAVNGGYKLVPIEPTPEMLKAG